MDTSLKADAGRIELAVHGLISEALTGICDFVKTGSRNASLNPSKSVYCNAPIPIIDLSAIHKTTMRIEIYVEQIGGFKDILTLSEIRDVIIPLVDGVTVDDSYVLSINNEMSAPDGTGFDFTLITLNVIVI